MYVITTSGKKAAINLKESREGILKSLEEGKERKKQYN